MKARLIRIGNSHGVRIPKTIIEQCGLTEEVELAVKDNVVIIAPRRGVRAGWEQAFQAMAEAGDDTLLIPESSKPTWDEEEWEW